MTQPVHFKISSLPALLLGLLGAGATLMAQARQTPPAQPGNKQLAPPLATKAPDPAFDHLDFEHWTYDGATNTTVGNDFVYTRGDSTTKGDRGKFKEIDKKKHLGILDAEGNLVYDDPQHHATCNKAHIDMTVKLAVFTENVVLVLKPDKAAAAPASGDAPDADNGIGGQKKRGATVNCDRMEDEYRKKYIKLFGHVVFRQSYKNKDGKQMERVLTAEHAEYNGKSDTLLLFGPVDGHDGDGQEIHTPNTVTVGTKEGKETLDGLKISIKFSAEEDSGDDANGDAGSAGDASGGKAKTGTDKPGTEKAGNAGKGQR